MSANDQFFYTDLPLQLGGIDQLVADESLYSKVPDDWHIVVTDVENSTQVVEAGNQQMVQLAATGSIVACLNIARKHQIEIPFFFGGDGATLLVPPLIIDACLSALGIHQERCERSFDFYLRVGSRHVSDMRQKGAVLELMKYRHNHLHIMPIILGNALQLAEREIKNAEVSDLQTEAMRYNLNLEGMECKWDKIKPPEDRDEVLALIVNATEVSKQAKVYAQVLEKIEDVYGDDTKRHPITAKRLKLVHKLRQIKNEVKSKYDKNTGFQVAYGWLRTLVGRWYLNYSSTGKQYVNDMIQLTETLLIDGSINTVIRGSVAQRQSLLAFLDDLEDQDQLQYGYYSSKTSVLSCYVTAIDNYHVHFLDGENGGYTQASKVLKAKRKAAQEASF